MIHKENSKAQLIAVINQGYYFIGRDQFSKKIGA